MPVLVLQPEIAGTRIILVPILRTGTTLVATTDHYVYIVTRDIYITSYVHSYVVK